MWSVCVCIPQVICVGKHSVTCTGDVNAARDVWHNFEVRCPHILCPLGCQLRTLFISNGNVCAMQLWNSETQFWLLLSVIMSLRQEFSR